MRCYVIGDIHGCIDELSYLIESLPLEKGDRLIFLGDYIDRGPDSRAVISYLLELQKAPSALELIFLKGNHEDMFLSFLGLAGNYGDMFLYNGGKATLESYGVHQTVCGIDLLSTLPHDHLMFYKSLSRYYLSGSFLCVHAGIQPRKPLEAQTESDIFWIRNHFIDEHHILPYTVLFGHTPQNEVFFDLPYKIGLDTGLVYGNKLSCLETEEGTVYQISRRSKNVSRLPPLARWKSATFAPLT